MIKMEFDELDVLVEKYFKNMKPLVVSPRVYCPFLTETKYQGKIQYECKHSQGFLDKGLYDIAPRGCEFSMAGKGLVYMPRSFENYCNVYFNRYEIKDKKIKLKK